MLGNLFKRMRAQAPTAPGAPNVPAVPAAPAPGEIPKPYSLIEALGDLPLIDILDVGAMMLGAEAPYGKLVENKRARLIGFEPNEEECRKLNDTYGAPHRFLPFFIGDGAAATFYETNFPMTGSLYKPNKALLEKFNYLEELTRLVQEHPTQTRRLDDLADLGNVDFFKIDVQGGELNVFKGAARTLASTLVIQTEVEFVSLYEGQPLFAEVDSYLRGQGFQFHTFLSFGQRAFKPVGFSDNPARGLRQYLWSDAIYVRDWMNLDALSVEQIKKYAVLLDHLYQSKDLVCMLLSHIDARTGANHTADYLRAWNASPDA